MTVWFTSDHHFGHSNIIKYCNRPFNSVEEMDTQLIELWNSVVGASDTVYHLGDFTFHGIQHFTDYIAKLNGQIKILPGSHDLRWIAGFKQNCKSYSGHRVVILPPLISLKFPLNNSCRPQIIVLCHYAMRVWDRSHHGSWHLYGHSHGKLPGQGLSFDVGVDCNEFKPISLEQVAERMAVKKAILTDQTNVRCLE